MFLDGISKSDRSQHQKNTSDPPQALPTLYFLPALVVFNLEKDL